MSANEKAEAFLIVVKRLLKWAAGLFLLLCGAVAALIGYEHYKDYERNKPRLATKYAGVALGDSAAQVRYALGDPVALLREPGSGEPWTKFGWVMTPEGAEKAELFDKATSWRYLIERDTLITVRFDRPGGAAISLECNSSSTYSCPEIFGLRDGHTEEAVREHLGTPDAERLKDTTKTLQYSRYNLTLSLEKKRVYQLIVSDLQPESAPRN